MPLPNRLALSLSLILLLLTLGGCAAKTGQQLQKAPPGWVSHQAQVAALDSWQLRGKFAIIDPEDRVSANMAWLQAEESYRLVITSMLGTTLAQIDGRPGEVSLSLPDEENWYDSEPEALLERLTGRRLPISLLHAWVRGLPGSEQASEQSWTPEGYLAAVTVPADPAASAASNRAPWKISFTGYKTVNGIALPHRLELQQAETRIKFAINHWQLPASSPLTLTESLYAP